MISELFTKFGGDEMVSAIGIETLAETESVTVNVKAYEPTDAVSEILSSVVPTVDVSKVTPGRVGDMV